MRKYKLKNKNKTLLKGGGSDQENEEMIDFDPDNYYYGNLKDNLIINLDDDYKIYPTDDLHYLFLQNKKTLLFFGIIFTDDESSISKFIDAYTQKKTITRKLQQIKIQHEPDKIFYITIGSNIEIINEFFVCFCKSIKEPIKQIQKNIITDIINSL